MQELRLLAHISKEKAFLDALRDNKDLHSYSASLLFDLKYEDFLLKDKDGNQVFDEHGDPIIVPEMKKKYRNPAKSITFG